MRRAASVRGHRICADAAVELFGLPYEYWSLGLFGVLGIALAVALLQRRHSMR